MVRDEETDLVVAGTPVGDVAARVWSPAAADGPLPWVVAHDGPAAASYGGMVAWARTGIASGELPPLRVVLLDPGDRDARYTADPDYADTLVEQVLPAVARAWPTDQPPILVGQSLGALAALHATWTHPGVFAGALLQSGSFFTPELDAQESGHPRWSRIVDFVGEVQDAERPPTLPPFAITCGTVEENYANNVLMALVLAGHGASLSWGEARKGHTWACWRGLLRPHLTDLVAASWGLTDRIRVG